MNKTNEGGIGVKLLKFSVISIPCNRCNIMYLQYKKQWMKNVGCAVQHEKKGTFVSFWTRTLYFILGTLHEGKLV